MNIELESCPFCKGEAKLDKYSMNSYEKSSVAYYENDGFWHYVWCTNCYAQAKDCLSEEEAVEAWNNRVDRDE